ncbi:MAG: hypothetical protein AAF581_17385 [Planctomycetota bacterium]
MQEYFTIECYNSGAPGQIEVDISAPGRFQTLRVDVASQRFVDKGGKWGE